MLVSGWLSFVLVVLGVSARALAQGPAGPPSTDPACANPPLDQCSFYANCLESRHHCGPDGYPIGFGQYFCEKFKNNSSLLDEQGQKWLINTMHCLELALVGDAINATQTTCKALKTQAYALHAGCYINNGFCTLGVKNWAAVLKIVNITMLFDSFPGYNVNMQVVAGCGEFHLYAIEENLF